MTKLLTLIPVFLLCSTSARAGLLEDVAAESRAPVERRFSTVSFGTRVGLAIPAGKLDAGTSTGQIFGPAMVQDLFIDIRLGGRFVVAPYAGYAKGTAGSELSCDGASSDSCLFGGFHVGGMARYTWLRTAAVDAWIGYAFARHWMVATTPGSAARFAGNDHHAAAGVDFFVNKRTDTRLGAYLDVAAGRYDQGTVTAGYGSFEVARHEVHQWTTVGMQLVF